MIDYELNNKIEATQKLTRLWAQFKEYYDIGKEGGKISKEQDEAFLECKKEIAMLHDEFVGVLPPADDVEGRKQQGTAKGIIEMVIKCVNLKQIKSFYASDHKNFEKLWDSAYQLLNGTVDKLEYKRDALAKMTNSQLAMQNFNNQVREKFGQFKRSPIPRVIGGAAFVLGALVVLQIMEIIDIQTLPHKIPKAEQFYMNYIEAPWRNQLQPDLPFTMLKYVPQTTTANPEGAVISGHNDSWIEVMKQTNANPIIRLLDGKGEFQLGLLLDNEGENTKYGDFVKLKIEDTEETFIYITFFHQKSVAIAQDIKSTLEEKLKALPADARRNVEKMYRFGILHNSIVVFSTVPLSSKGPKGELHLEKYSNVIDSYNERFSPYPLKMLSE